jgi:hypothetical protein
MRDAVVDVEMLTSAPYSLIAMAAFTAASTACQGLIDVKLPIPGNKTCPVSLFSLFIGESGERRTTVNKLLCHSITEHDQKKASAYEDALSAYKKEHEVWRSIKRKLVQAITKAVMSGDSAYELELKLEDHIKVEPDKPLDTRIIQQRSSTTALLQRLHGQSQSIAFISDEAQMMFEARSTRDFGYFSKLWDGASVLSNDRTDKTSFVARDPRAALCVMAHPVTFNKFNTKHGELARGSGYWARFLVAQPPSKKGYRVRHVNGEALKLPSFNARVTELLDIFEKKDQRERCTKLVLEFSDEAAAQWTVWSNGVEDSLRPGNSLSKISDFAAKYMETMSRLAAIMHYFCGMEGPISLETLRRAEKIALWHLEEYRRLFALEKPQDESDAELYIKHLYVNYWLRGRLSVERKTLSHGGPFVARVRWRRDAALALLIERRVLTQVFDDPETQKDERLHLNPEYFNSAAVQAVLGIE